MKSTPLKNQKEVMCQSTDEMHNRSSNFWAQLDIWFHMPFISISFQ